MIVSRGAKKGIIACVWIIACVVLVLSFVKLFSKEKETPDQTLYTSNIVANLDYKVRLVNNPVYGVASFAEESDYYVTPFTNYIQLDASINLNGSSEATVITNENIKAYLVSYIDSGNNEEIIWEKEYEISEALYNEVIGVGASTTTSAELYFDEFKDLIDALNDTYSFRTRYYVKVVYDTEVTVNYQNKSETKVLKPYIKITMEDMLYEIEPYNEASTTIAFAKEMPNQKIPKLTIMFLGVLATILLAVFAILLSTRFLQESPMTLDEKRKSINLKYGDRIVDVIEHPSFEVQSVRLASLEDVVKVADEITQPIFCSRLSGKIYYYVINNEIMYFVII